MLEKKCLDQVTYSLSISKDENEIRCKIIDGLRRYNEPQIGYWGESTHFIYDAKIGDKLIGGLVGFYASYYAKIGWLWVDEEYRGKKIATELLKLTEDFLKSQGCELIHLDTFNPKAAELYKFWGYNQIGYIPKFIKSTPCYFLEKKL